MKNNFECDAPPRLPIHSGLFRNSLIGSKPFSLILSLAEREARLRSALSAERWTNVRSSSSVWQRKMMIRFIQVRVDPRGCATSLQQVVDGASHSELGGPLHHRIHGGRNWHQPEEAPRILQSPLPETAGKHLLPAAIGPSQNLCQYNGNLVHNDDDPLLISGLPFR